MWLRIRFILRNLLKKQQVNSDLDAEIRSYIDAVTEEKMASGLHPDEARRCALAEIGGVEQVKQSVRNVRAGAFVDSIGRDVRFALRQLVRSPGFSVTAILSLGLGIAATVAVFSVAYGVLLHPFPYRDVDRLCNVSVRDAQRATFDEYFLGPELMQVSKLHAFESIATWRRENMSVTGGDVPEAVNAYYGLADTFPTLGVAPLLGRNLGPADAPDGQEPQPVVELHYRFWQRHFNADLDVIGKTLELDHKAYTIIGVTGPGFTWDWGADLYLPQAISDQRGGGLVAKLRRGVSPAAANAELQPLLLQFSKEHPREYSPHYIADLHPLAWEVTHNIGSTIWVLFAGVGLLLAIGCCNVSILLLARNSARQHELAVRLAIGAGNSRIVRQLMTESLLLAVVGTVLGVGMAYRLLALIVAWLPQHLFPPDVSIRINLPVLLFSVGLALVTTIIFGLLPALQMVHPKIAVAIQSGSRTMTGTLRSRHLHSALVSGQIALTLLLLSTAGAAMEGFVRLLRVPLGYDPHNVVAVGIPLHENTYTTWQGRTSYFEELRASVASLAGVTAASIAGNAIPPNSGWELPFELRGTQALTPDARLARIHLVDSNYFNTLRTPLIKGRIWTPAEIANAAGLVLVNESFIRRYDPSLNAVGHFLRVPKLQNTSPQVLMAPGADGWLQVIGVVGDAVNGGIDQPVEPAIFAPYSLEGLGGTEILVRTHSAPRGLVSSLRKQIAAVNPEQQTYGTISDLEKWIEDEAVWGRTRLISTLFAGFSILALALSGVGLYSVASYLVVQRTSEFAIRIALGATPSHVIRLVTASAGAGVVPGIAAGLILSIGFERILAAWAGITSSPLLFISGAALLLLATAAIASLGPTRRALSVDPMIILRSE
jgi:putative ABC transport system permease protein